MKIEIKSRFDSNIILIVGEYENIKDCLEKNSRANLSGANLVGADLSRANLFGANLFGANLFGADLSGADLVGADLSRANLSRADLIGANLSGANLSRADLIGARNYVNSHEFAVEIIRRQKIETFTDEEWSLLGKILICLLCWNTIKKKFGDKIIPILKKLSTIGFDEWEKSFMVSGHPINRE